jgi:hypothetical protein
MTDKPTIWVINDAGHPVHKALDLVPNAEIKPLTLGDINPLRVDRTAHHIARGITKYGKDGDYLLLSGYLTVNVIAVSLWLLFFGNIRIIQWNAKKKHYELTDKTEDDLRSLLQREMERA